MHNLRNRQVKMRQLFFYSSLSVKCPQPPENTKFIANASALRLITEEKLGKHSIRIQLMLY